MLAALLALAIVGVYWRVTGLDFVSLDDGQYVTRNPRVQAGLTVDSLRWALTTTHDANWFPLTWLSHMLAAELFGLRPAGHHLVNLLFHTVNAVLLFFVLTRLSGMPWRSLVVAALFALHPLHVESVAWIAARKDVLSGFFWMLILAAYVSYLARPAWTRYFALLVLFAAGLLAKPMLVTLPFVLLLLDYWPLGRLTGSSPSPGGATVVFRRPPALLVLEKTPLFILSAVSCFITYQVQHKGGAVIANDQTRLLNNMANALVSYGKYLLKTFWPVDLAAYYPFAVALPPWQVATATLFLSGMSLLAVVSRRRAPWFAVGWFWYLGTLVPVIGLVRIGDMALADRYTYLPLIGVFVAVVWGMAEMSGQRLPRQIFAGAALACLLVSGSLAWRQVGFWKNSTVMMRHALAVTKNNWLIQSNLAAVLIDEGNLDEAYGLLTEALRLNPDNAEARNNMGSLLMKRGANSQAISSYKRAIELDPRNPDVYLNLVKTALEAGDLATARGAYRALNAIDPQGAKELRTFISYYEQMHGARRNPSHEAEMRNPALR